MTDVIFAAFDVLAWVLLLALVKGLVDLQAVIKELRRQRMREALQNGAERRGVPCRGPKCSPPSSESLDPHPRRVDHVVGREAEPGPVEGRSPSTDSDREGRRSRHGAGGAPQPGATPGS